jgi:hypothetical protein
MKTNLFLVAITLLNAGILAMPYIQNHRPASLPGADQILRGRGLQIVDDSGHVRASTNRTYVQALAGGSASAVVVKSEDGGERRIEP